MNAVADAVRTVTIRDATDADLPRLLEMAQGFLTTTAYGARVPFDAEHFTRLAELLRTQGRLFVAVRESRVVGMLGVLVLNHPISNERVGNEIVWWVDPEARSLNAWRALFRDAERWAREVGAVRMQFGAYHDDRLERLYRHLGYDPHEVVYEKALE